MTEPTLDEVKTDIHNMLDIVETGLKEMQVDFPSKDDIFQAVDYFRKVTGHKDATRDYLVMVAWAINLGTVYGILQKPVNVIITTGLDGLADVIGEVRGDDDEQVH